MGSNPTRPIWNESGIPLHCEHNSLVIASIVVCHCERSAMCPLGMAIPPFPVIARYEAISPFPVIARNMAISPFPVIARNVAISPFMSTPLWGLRAKQSCHHDLILSLRAERGNLTLSCHREERGDLALHLNAPLGVASGAWQSHPFLSSRGTWRSHPFLSSRGTWRSRLFRAGKQKGKIASFLALTNERVLR